MNTDHSTAGKELVTARTNAWGMGILFLGLWLILMVYIEVSPQQMRECWADQMKKINIQSWPAT